MANRGGGWRRDDMAGPRSFTSRHRLAPAWLAIALFAWHPVAAGAGRPSDAEAIAQMIRASRLAYGGACPCPDSVMANGRRCGARSAWSRPGGESPLCYPADVTPEMLREWRQQHPDTR